MSQPPEQKDPAESGGSALREPPNALLANAEEEEAAASATAAQQEQQEEKIPRFSFCALSCPTKGQAVAVTDVALPIESKDPNADLMILSRPKRPLSAYNMFFQDQHKLLLQQRHEEEEEKEEQANNLGKGGSVKKRKIPFHDLGRIIGYKWRNITAAEKHPYQVRAQENLALYKEQAKAWKAQQYAFKKQRKAQERRAQHKANSLLSHYLSTTEQSTSPPQAAAAAAAVPPPADKNDTNDSAPSSPQPIHNHRGYSNRHHTIYDMFQPPRFPAANHKQPPTTISPFPYNYDSNSWGCKSHVPLQANLPPSTLMSASSTKTAITGRQSLPPPSSSQERDCQSSRKEYGLVPQHNVFRPLFHDHPHQPGISSHGVTEKDSEPAVTTNSPTRQIQSSSDDRFYSRLQLLQGDPCDDDIDDDG